MARALNETPDADTQKLESLPAEVVAYESHDEDAVAGLDRWAARVGLAGQEDSD